MSSPEESATGNARKEQRQRDYARFLTLQPRFAGARALYREGIGVSLVRVAVLEPNPTRFVAGIELIPTRGLYNERPPKWPISATWDVFGFDHHVWGCGYLSLTVYFDPGVIDHVLAQAAAAEPVEYSRECYWEIGRWMNDHRRSVLAKHRLQTLALTWNGVQVAELADHWLSEYPLVNSRLLSDALAPDVRAALADYGAWWNRDDDGGDSPSSPFGEALFVGWEVVTPDGKRFESSIPKFDFPSSRVEWRCGGLVPE